MALGPVMARSATSNRQSRVELLGGIRRLEHAVEAPAGDPTWRPGMTRAVSELKAAFTKHVDLTEGPAGLYAGLLEHAPRLARGLSELVDEHNSVVASLTELEDRLGADPDVEEVRQHAAQLLREVWQHRQRGADLVYEAYATDIGGET